MPFQRANIDRAIVMTQYDLRGFSHPLGIRLDKPTPKYLDAITCNFIAMAAGLMNEPNSVGTVDDFVDYFGEGSFEDFVSLYQKLAKDCTGDEKEAIVLIFDDIVKMNEKLHAEVASGAREPSPYLQPLEKENRWGRTVLAFRKAFEPEPEQVAA